MPNESIFTDEWRDCLRAHYTYVIRTQDKITERTLHGVLIEAGFTETELKELTVRATMRVEDVGEDFVPDMAILAANEAAETAASFAVPAITVPQEVIEAELVEESVALDEVTATEAEMTVEASAEIDESELDESEMDESELEDESDGEADDEPPPAPDATQLSLF